MTELASSLASMLLAVGLAASQFTVMSNFLNRPIIGVTAWRTVYITELCTPSELQALACA